MPPGLLCCVRVVTLVEVVCARLHYANFHITFFFHVIIKTNICINIIIIVFNFHESTAFVDR